ncbi:MAG: mechanosensitive ion channel family protein [Candidatus Thalassarchaeaceae archaeon]|nr:mechanosensitive ion channel family protein [Candidatus Thalassarchaeaceae archaeon]
MADDTNDLFTPITELVQQIVDLGVIYQIGFCLVIIALSLLIVKLVFTRIAWRIVKKTKNDWDNAALIPIINRIYVFVLALGIEVSIDWIDGEGEGLIYSNVEPYFSATYILLTTSLISVGIKYIIPAIFDKYTVNKSVTVTGGNPIMVFISRGIVWFIGLNLALDIVGIELFGILASLAVFSLIIGLAVQQTLGNIVNSFMLAIDQPFEVGDRIEVDGIQGNVVSVGILSTKILTFTEQLVIIPNNRLIDSTITNFARGGGDGVATRVSLHMDIGVDYDENSAHVKQVITAVARKCKFVNEDPAPRVLLRELGDFAKIFRLYTWIEDYDDEFFAKDWLLREIDIRFGIEGISIPYPVSVELEHKPSPFGDNEQALERRMRRKSSRQQVATMTMARDESALMAERDEMKQELEYLQSQITQGDMKRTERENIENDIRSLEVVLAQFSD